MGEAELAPHHHAAGVLLGAKHLGAGEAGGVNRKGQADVGVGGRSGKRLGQQGCGVQGEGTSGKGVEVNCDVAEKCMAGTRGRGKGGPGERLGFDPRECSAARFP